MVDSKIVENLEIENFTEKLCKGCVYGKQHRNSFPKEGATRWSKAGERFHADLCGKMSVSTPGGANYFFFAIRRFF